MKENKQGWDEGNFAVEGSAALLHAWELPGSIFGPETGNSDYRLLLFSSEILKSIAVP
jgi:hypothetical protein